MHGDAEHGTEYDVTLYSPDGRMVRAASLQPAVPGDRADDPAAVAFAVTETDDVVVLYERGDGTEGMVLARYASAFERPRAAPSRSPALSDYRMHLPVTAGDSYTALSLHYLSGDWLFNGPAFAATDDDGILYVSSRWANNISAFLGDRRRAWTVEDGYMGGDGVLMRCPGALAAAAGCLYVYDGGNGRIVRLSTVLPGSSTERRRLESYERPIVLKHARERAVLRRGNREPVVPQ